ncbi:mannose-1-phosphate guanylyltransferase [Chitinophaga sp. ysch24]|uniref:mannose-1-phosphate guanylyltransferase n=2 Tax=Chitinophaga tropicalis TaxID=2683588 RepID=A0A7K1TZI0_9BACT|nr:mannose-1-phosphate guanylyltransferase [Chitinophaga tropicalis]
MTSHNYIFIMAGGVGSRFWPKSRNAYPKQFIDILGIGRSLLQLTYDRFLKVCPAENIFIVTNSAYKELIQEQLPDLAQGNILCEPSRNNTAPCISYAAFKIAAKDPEACMVIAPSDHFILHEDVFVNDIRHSLETVARKDILLTLGISPTRPDTGYGYIRFEQKTEDRIHKVIQFTEKPVLEKAKEFLKSGDYVWNAGIFIWSAKTILQAFELLSPQLFDLFNQGKDVYNTGEEQAFINKNYPLSPNISIDYAIMEKAANVYTMPVNFGWSDLGTWASLYQTADKNIGINNVLAGGELQLEETEDCIIHLPKDKLAVIRGLKDFIVVDDKDVLLIYPKSSEQEIKKITERLKEQDKGHYL